MIPRSSGAALHIPASGFVAGAFILLFRRNDASADDVAHDQGDEKGEGSLEPLPQKRVLAPSHQVDHVENKEQKWAKYSRQFKIIHGCGHFETLAEECE
jgi:hypothetical protein